MTLSDEKKIEVQKFVSEYCYKMKQKISTELNETNVIIDYKQWLRDLSELIEYNKRIKLRIKRLLYGVKNGK